MPKYRMVFFCSVTLASSSVFAGEMGKQETNFYSWLPVLELNIGPAWENNGQSQNLYLQEDVQKYYAAQKKSHTILNGEIYYGWRRAISSLWTGQIGLAFAAASNTQLQGDIWEDSDPEFNNYYYTYKVNPMRLAAKGKILANVNLPVKPYAFASIGASFNRAHSFVITPKIFEEVPAPPFNSNTKSSFSYTLGLGVQKEFNTHWQTGIGYEFADWGRSTLAKGIEQTINEGLNLNHLYTHTLQFSLGYIA